MERLRYPEGSDLELARLRGYEQAVMDIKDGPLSKSVVETRVCYIHTEDGDSPTVFTWGDDYWGSSPDAFANSYHIWYEGVIAWVETRLVTYTDWVPDFPKEML